MDAFDGRYEPQCAISYLTACREVNVVGRPVVAGRGLLSLALGADELRAGV
jgi:hypothetical protein